MSGNDSEAKFSLSFEGNAADFSDDAAEAVEGLRSRIEESLGSIKDMSASYRSLRGSSKEAVDVKNELKAKITALRDAVSSENIALIKQGTSYEKLTSEAKKLAKQKDELKKKNEAKALAEEKERITALTNAIKTSGGPVDSLRGKLATLKDIAGGTGGGMALATLAVTGFIAISAKLAASLAGAAVSLGSFILQSANMLRALGLNREAALGNAESAQNLGEQIEQLSRKVPLSREALNDLSISLVHTRLNGDEIVDTMNLVATASAAAGDQIGNTFKDIVTRGAMVQRFQLNPRELFGTGVEYKDVATQLAKQLNVGIDEAQKALFEGRVKLADGAKALKAAIDARFGAVNAKKMIDLNVLAETFQKRLTRLTSGLNLEPLLQGLDSLSSLFDESTVTGAALKQIVTTVGTDLGKALVKVGPIAKTVFKSIVLAMLELINAGYDVRDSLSGAFGDSKLTKNLVTMQDVIIGTKIAVVAIGAAFVALGAAVALAAAPFISLYVSFVKLVEGIETVRAKFREINWRELGLSVTDGISKGIDEGIGKVEDSIKNLTRRAKGMFTTENKIHSPSEAYAEEAEEIPAGAAAGIRRKSGVVADAIQDMAPAPGGGATAGAAAGGGGAPISLTVQINVNSGSKGEDVAAALSAPAFMGQFVDAVELLLKQAGITPMKAVT